MSNYEKVEQFMAAVNELVDGKFMTADTTMTEILRRIAASRELTELFTAVVKGYDYARARRTYLRFPAEKGSAHGVAYLPTERSEILAFVFCLFVEFDAGSMQFGDFLLRYFYVDGSYTASYTVFVERMIKPFREILRDCFPREDAHKRDEARRSREEIFGALSERIPAEKVRLSAFGLRREEWYAADLILSELAAAAGRQDSAELGALMAGYRYFLRYFGGEDEESEALFSLASRL